MFHFFVIAGLVALAVIGLRRRYFSDIRDVPGPVIASVGRAWQLWRLIKGDIDKYCIALHEKHGMYASIVARSSYLPSSIGPFVRISHDEVSVCHPEAIKKILLSPLHKVRHLFYEHLQGRN